MLPAVPYNTTCALPACPAPFISSMVKLGPLVNAKKLPGVRLREYWVLFVAFGSRDPRYYINRKSSELTNKDDVDEIWVSRVYDKGTKGQHGDTATC